MSTTRVTPEFLWALGRVGPAIASRDGFRVVTTVTRYDMDDNKGTTRIYGITSSPSTALASNSVSSTEPALSDSGSMMAFVRVVDDVRQIHVMATTGDEARAVTDVPIGATSPQWLPDESGLVFLSMVYRNALTHEQA